MDIEIKKYGQYREIKNILSKYDFVNDQEEVERIKQKLGGSEELKKFDSFFIKTNVTTIEEIIGMKDVIPDLDKTLYKITGVK